MYKKSGKRAKKETGEELMGRQRRCEAEEDTEKDKGGLADGGNISPCLRKLRSKADAVVRV